MVVCLAGGTFAADRPVRTVVLDPGHGGHDAGATGVNGTLEKDINLTLARRVKNCLAGTCRVVLTRTGDYRLTPADRTAIANHVNADLFVSIHTGGDFSHISGAVVISYMAGPASGMERRLFDGPSCVVWDGAQIPHLNNSRTLANVLEAAFARILRTDSVVQEARFAVLEGAQMPAVLVEAGYITNPAREQQFQDKRSLAAIADSICTAIDQYLKAHVSR